ncbi:MAG: hypothetical protein ABW004_06150, partial [Aeromicrobium sp.]
VDRTVGAAPWAEKLPDVLELLAGVEGLELEIRGDGTVEIGGTVADESERTRVLRKLDRALDLDVVGTFVLTSSRTEG